MSTTLLGLILSILPGDVVYSNLQTSSSSASAGYSSPVRGYAQEFEANNDFTGLTSLKINLGLFTSYTGSAGFSVNLYRDTAGLPSTLAAGISESLWSGRTVADTAGYYELSNINFGTTLTSGSYWLTVTSTSGVNFRWSLGDDPNSNPTASWDGTTWTNQSSGNSLGAYIETTAVPEPGTLILGFLCVGVGCVFWAFRKRRHGTPATA